MTLDTTEHVIAALLLLARIGDIGSTWLATPNLLLEANPVARTFRWPFAFLTLLAALVPYWDLAAGIMILVASLLVCASNFSKVWIMRTMGEAAYHDFIVALTAKAHPTLVFIMSILSALSMGAVGGALLMFYPTEAEPAYWFAIGFIIYGIVMIVWGLHAFLRFRRQGKADNAA